MVTFPQITNAPSQKELDEFLKKQKENFNKFLDNVKDLNRNAESEIYKQDQLRKEIQRDTKIRGGKNTSTESFK